MKISHKISILLLKYIPFIIELLYTINTLLTPFGIFLPIGKLCGMSIISMTFLYATSYAFSFCFYHRIFLHYVVLIECLDVLDSIFRFSIHTDIFIIIQLLLFLICAFVALYLHMKKHEIRIIKTRT